MTIDTLSAQYAGNDAAPNQARPSSGYSVDRHADYNGRAVITTEDRTGRQPKRRGDDEVSISNRSGNRGDYPTGYDRPEAALPDNLRKVRNPDARLASWFRTALNLQETEKPDKNRISLYV